MAGSDHAVVSSEPSWRGSQMNPTLTSVLAGQQVFPRNALLLNQGTLMDILLHSPVTTPLPLVPCPPITSPLSSTLGTCLSVPSACRATVSVTCASGQRHKPRVLFSMGASLDTLTTHGLIRCVCVYSHEAWKGDRLEQGEATYLCPWPAWLVPPGSGLPAGSSWPGHHEAGSPRPAGGPELQRGGSLSGKEFHPTLMAHRWSEDKDRDLELHPPLAVVS